MPYQFKSYRETSVAGGFAMAQAEPAADLVGAVLRFQGFEALAPMSFMDRAKADLFLPLIINFGERRLKDGLVRVLNPDKLNRLRDEDEYEDDDEEYEDDD